MKSIKKVVVMREEWTVDNNLLTPTMKVKRNILEKEKTPHYEKWYKEAGDVIWEN
jgi:long-chain acyl-CoA synthetase